MNSVVSLPHIAKSVMMGGQIVLDAFCYVPKGGIVI